MLLLVPTPLEQEILKPIFGDSGFGDVPLVLCGFGPIAAAARTAQLVDRHNPASVILVGIAGSYSDRLAVGSATTFDSVACYGIGAGTGAEFQTATQLGWPHWSKSRPQLTGTLLLGSPHASNSGQLLTVCAAAASEDDVTLRRTMFPDAVAEDMEGFGVAMACALADIPLRIVRGISNEAGDRDKSHWKITDALQTAADLTVQLLSNA